MKNIQIIILFLLTTTSVYSQRIISGTITSSNNDIPIANVNISFQNVNLGTISNSNGGFEIITPNDPKYSVLVFSYIGYKNYYLRIDSLKKFTNLKLKLEPQIIQLDAILLEERKEYNADEVIDFAINNMKNNLITNPYIAEGFLRHTEKSSNQVKWLIEAAISVYDEGYLTDTNNIQISIDELRKSIDNRDLDSTYLYTKYLTTNKGFRFKKALKSAQRKDYSDLEFTKALNYLDNQKSSLELLLKSNQNLIRYAYEKNAILDDDFKEKHTFKLDSMVTQNDRFLYKIKILPSSKNKRLNNLLKDNYLPIGWIYIYADNFAIKELTYSLIGSEKRRESMRIFTGTEILYTLNYKFKSYYDKMFLTYISKTEPKIIGTEATENYLENNLKDNFNLTKQEILFSNYVTNEDVIETKMKSSKNNGLFEKRPYNAEFWKNYNILLETEEEAKMIKDLEKKMSLKEQFEKN
ncbi:carboxypeptidase-like regulatory domain-containing protein [uncultured Nonlabens sp.]|uniref:carboxypeptidase-like regulatory domain-containing protein n=1 Tax=uncultured Nonlabens sp. TaxID=859306 RepID=UPI0026071BC4|nr:carboxypeptidase-like regulatory domain-containing protein [uncultured Nonlabens sp.]